MRPSTRILRRLLVLVLVLVPGVAHAEWFIDAYAGSVFAEYRYTQFLPDDVKAGGLKYSADVKTNHALGGFSFRF